MTKKAYAKVNIFLKISGKRGNYHEFISRFMRVENLYDELSFFPKSSAEFTLDGDFNCEISQNTIYKAYLALLKHTSSKVLEEFMQKNGLKVVKNIPSFAGLGGGSSDAATFLHMCNESLKLNLTLDELAKIGLSVGADVPFFIYNFKSANVSGIGDVVEEFNEEPISIETITPQIEISTPAVYKEYRENFYSPISQEVKDKFQNMSSLHVVQNYGIEEANDLFLPAKKLYPQLNKYVKGGWFFSGSGSSFFRLSEVSHG
ncbi:MAG: 4-(cytidine 5'-diphospho)-2-C-methyl-D-erythritol kinase [Campylobacterota bacterium]|nr:4-(cytidine 5'-diphospho)-2-C-methyl-D-erythritol kinase [Campylobacterota bacterium]